MRIFSKGRMIFVKRVYSAGVGLPNQNNYTCGNCLTSELAMKGFETYQCWGDWTAPSVDLQDAFGVSPAR